MLGNRTLLKQVGRRTTSLKRALLLGIEIAPIMNGSKLVLRRALDEAPVPGLRLPIAIVERVST